MRTDVAPYGNTIRRALPEDIVAFYRSIEPVYEDFPDETVLQDWIAANWAWEKWYDDED